LNGAYFYPDIPEGEERDGFAHEGAHFISTWYDRMAGDTYPSIPRLEIGSYAMPFCIRPASNNLYQSSQNWVELNDGASYLILSSTSMALIAFIL